MRYGPVALIILDGWGLAPAGSANAITCARTPYLDHLMEEYPHSSLEASGVAVGLIRGQMGNSNVGHLNIGAGRVVYQDLGRISRAVETGELAANAALGRAIAAVAGSGGSLHLMGLVSDGGVHSHEEHLWALLELAAGRGVKRLYVHAFLDGRDVPPQSAGLYLERLENKLREVGRGRVASICGRYYAMDRDQRWDRLERAYRCLVQGEGYQAASAAVALQAAYDRGETDEFVAPTVIGPREEGRLAPEDWVIFFNFRADRARELSHALTDAEFGPFPRPYRLPNLVTMTRYEEGLPVDVAFPPLPEMVNTLGEWVCRQGLRQLRLAETEKYAHVTYFFNGGREEPFPGEDRVLIPSPKVATYDLEPAMSAQEITRAGLERLASGDYALLVVNYANGDMVGHTGCREAAIRAAEVVDTCLSQLVPAVVSSGGQALIISDHGNAEEMIDPDTGQPHTAHTPNRVPCILVSERFRGRELRPGRLADVAPTVCELLGLPVPPEMTGESLITKETK
ncbi:MAG: 2,3-bisphosphoglycerate-independent phosphoglycerate mutase [Bacillota bacterium]